MKIVASPSPDASRAACIAITETISEWFGQSAANERYANEIGDCDCFLADDGSNIVGLIALQYHYERTAEIWWLGVRRDLHRHGVGRALIAAAIERAETAGCNMMVLETLSPEHPDPGYAKTRAFYRALGFSPLVRSARGTGGHPMMWMIRPVDGGGFNPL